jgi:hypothetical protein
MAWHHPPRDNWHLVENGKVNTRELRLWLKQMSQWGAKVRRDILRIEKHLKLAAGDPGAPPPPPE